jgi:hypothetical protein
MASAEDYAKWIVGNADKKGTPEFDTVAKAYKAAKSGSEPADQTATAQQEVTGTSQSNLAGNFAKGVGVGGLALAGLPVDTVANVLDLGKAAAGTIYHEATGKPIPEALELQPRDQILGSSAQIINSVAGDKLNRTGGTIPDKLAYSIGATVVPALATKNLGAGMSAKKALSYGAASGVGAVAGGEVGQELGGKFGKTIGEIAGGLAAPVAAGATARSVTNAGKGIADFGKKMFGPADEVADRVAAERMQTNIVRSGETPEALAAKVSTLGDEGMLADTSPTLASLLGVAGRANPRVAGDVGRQLYARHEGQAGRLKFAVDGGAIGAKEVISRIANETKQAIKSMYQKAAGELNQTYGGALPPKIEQMLSGETSISKASKKINQQMRDAKEAGLESTPFDRINYTKQVLDDQISKLYRKGANNEARILVALKNKFIAEADSEIPSFKEARDLFAGKTQLENAARDGELIFKMPVEDIKSYVAGLSKSEKAMYILGGQKAALQRIDDAQIVGDASKKLLGKNGDIDRMKILFDEPGAFEKFKSSIQREADFLMTKRQFSGSQTAERLDAKDANRLPPTTIPGVISRTLGMASGKRQEKINDLAYKKIGDVLTKNGLTISELNAFLSKAESRSTRPELGPRIKAKAAQISTVATQDKREEKK